MRVLLDTNIVLRYVNPHEPEHAVTRAALNRLVQNGAELLICNQNLYELWVVATRAAAQNGMGLAPEQVRHDILVLIATFTWVGDPQDLVMRWLDLCHRYTVLGRPAHDTRFVALMLAHEVTHILTLNPGDFTRYAEITVLQPADV